MIEAGLEVLESWADDYGIEVIPASYQLVQAVLEAALSHRS